MQLHSPPWSPACGHELPKWPNSDNKPPTLPENVELHYHALPCLRQISQCNRCFYDLSAVEYALSFLDRTLFKLEAVQSTYTSPTSTEMTTPPPRQPQCALKSATRTPQTKAIKSHFTIGDYTLRGEESDIVARNVIKCIVSDISGEVDELRQRMDKIWASESHPQTHPSRQRVDVHQRIEQLIDDLLARAWAAVGRSNLRG